MAPGVTSGLVPSLFLELSTPVILTSPQVQSLGSSTMFLKHSNNTWEISSWMGWFLFFKNTLK